MKIETKVTNDEGNPEFRDIEQKGEFETIYMREIEKYSRIYEKNPAMITPLVNHLHFDGMTQYGNDILLGIIADIPDLEPLTRSYINYISTTTPSLPDQDHPISL